METNGLLFGTSFLTYLKHGVIGERPTTKRKRTRKKKKTLETT